jgi:hypothetical protein
MTYAGASPDPRQPGFNRDRTAHFRKRPYMTISRVFFPDRFISVAVKYLPKVKERKVKNLLNTKAEAEAADKEVRDHVVTLMDVILPPFRSPT